MLSAYSVSAVGHDDDDENVGEEGSDTDVLRMVCMVSSRCFSSCCRCSCLRYLLDKRDEGAVDVVGLDKGDGEGEGVVRVVDVVDSAGLESRSENDGEAEEDEEDDDDEEEEQADSGAGGAAGDGAREEFGVGEET